MRAAAGERHAAGRHLARPRREGDAVALVVELEDAGDAVGAFGQPLARDLGDQQVAVAAESLRRGVVDQLLGRDEHVRIGQLERGGQRDRDAQPVAGQREARRAVEQRRQRRAPLVEARIARPLARRQPQRQRRAFGHADLVGAGEPVAP